jgi:hypothetical protein
LASHKRTKECKAFGANEDKIHISIVEKWISFMFSAKNWNYLLQNISSNLR